ncbi:MAG: V-type ATP synthase subunit D [Ignavibacteriales bacterium]|nr:V-type ATP synthase subunit D [Ignavibacteriales bacterium]
MAIKFQYNKTSLHEINKQLKVRIRALPTLKNKESALRMEVKRAKDKTIELNELFEKEIKNYENLARLWNEFDINLVDIEDVKLSYKKIAGVSIPILENVIFKVKIFSLFTAPDWFLMGIEIIKNILKIAYEREVFKMKMKILEHARRKTTQKVNLYEKVQIPGYEDAIRKIKRFLEDEENLSKSAQKILKSRTQDFGD